MSETVSSSERASAELPIFEGHLFKRSSAQGLGYQKRYFVLYSNRLVYYPHKRSYQLSVKNGKKIGTILKLDGLYLSKTENCNQHGAQHCFTLHVPNDDNKRRELPLATTCRKSKNLWMELLQEQNPALLPAIGERTNSLPTYIEKIRMLGSGSVRQSSSSLPLPRRQSSPAQLNYQTSHTASANPLALNSKVTTL